MAVPLQRIPSEDAQWVLVNSVLNQLCDPFFGMLLDQVHVLLAEMDGTM